MPVYKLQIGIRLEIGISVQHMNFVRMGQALIPLFETPVTSLLTNKT